MSDKLKQLVPAEDALQIVLSKIPVKQAEQVAVSDANGRILASDLASLRTQPPFDASAMDGYAVRQEDITDLPAILRLIGQSRAGEPYTGSVGSGEAVRIFTGAVVPDGADSIVIQENVSAGGDEVTVLEGVQSGKFIRKSGLDFKEGQVLLKKGDQLKPFKLALAASMNHSTVPVHKKPIVALISTGDELVLPGETTADGQIIASNTFGLAASITNTGGQLIDMGIVKDTQDALRTAFENAIDQNVDLIVTTGGASVGDHDLVLPVAKSLGFEFEVAKIAMRPGKPFLFAKLQKDNRIIYLTGLAGNPVSSLVAYHVFVKPLIQIMCGKKAETVEMHSAVLGRDLPENDERAEYMRATLTKGEQGELIATAFDNQDSSMLANLVRADCLLYRRVNAPAGFKGESCKIVFIE